MIVIHHNPDCGTSRNVVALVKAAGYAPEVIEYLQTGWTKPQLLGLFAAAGLTPRQALELLRDGKPARLTEPKDDEEARLFRQAQLLTAKPVLYVCNVAEEDAATGNALSEKVFEKAKAEGAEAVVVSAAIEAELVGMDNTFLTPHIGSGSAHTRAAMGDLVADNLVAWFEKGEAVTPVPEAKAKGLSKRP